MNGLAAVVIWAPVVLAAAIVPGAAWVLAAGPTDRSRAESVGTSLALSPGLYGGAIALLLGAGVQLRIATAVALASFALVAATAAWAHRRRGVRAVATPSPDARAAWVAAVGVAGLVALLPLLSEWWRIYSDAWNHFAITRAVVERGAHPLDPFFAGLPLQYPWIYHAQMASLTASTGASAFALMPLWSAFALVGVLLCGGPLAARLSGRTQVWGLVLLLFGLNAAFPLFMPLLLAKALTGTVRGWPEIERTFTLAPFGVTRVTSFLQSLGGQDFFLNKFMVTTPFALGLAAYTAFAACLLRWLDHRDGRELWLASGAMLSAGLMHPIVGLDLVGATIGLTVVAFLAPGSLGLQRSDAASLASAVVAGAIPVALYTSRIMGGQEGSHHEIPIDISVWKLLGLYSTLALGLLLAFRPMLGLVRTGGPRRAWAAWIGLHLAIATLIRTPGPSSFFSIDKFSYLVWIPLALTGGAGLETLLARRGAPARLAILVLLFVPVTGLAVAGRLADPHAGARQPWALPGLVWMRSHLPADAVLVVPYDDPVTGNYVGRDQYMSDEAIGQVLGYPAHELAVRRILTERFFATDSLAPDDASRLRGLGRSVYAVWTRFDDPRLAVTPRTVWWGYGGNPKSDPRPHWEGRYPIVYASGTHIVAELVPVRTGAPLPPAVGTPAPSR